MTKKTINPSHIHDKSINFLIGAGASVGLFPTLELNIKSISGEKATVESLGEQWQETDKPRYTSLFMHYYASCIEPVMLFNPVNVMGDDLKRQVMQNYEAFINTTLKILARKKGQDKRCNIFTTNYDGCMSYASDALLSRNSSNFIVNDGSRGFLKRTLQTRNFNSYVCQTGIFERAQTGLAQINLIHTHGSVYWKRVGEDIEVDYRIVVDPLISTETITKISAFRTMLMDPTACVEELPSPALDKNVIDDFWLGYKKLPIVNPTKWKFHETVFDEHYYQMLRMLSYEIERPNCVLITFGFSFADEHIRNLIKRSLSNPSLQVYVCCFSSRSADVVRGYFGTYPNVEIIEPEAGEFIDFTAFNKDIFKLEGEAVLAIGDPL